MADSFTANLNLRKPEVGAATDTWGGVAGLNGDMDLLDALFAPTGAGTSVGLNIGAGKTLGLTGTITAAAAGIANFIAGNMRAAAARFFVHDATDQTKILQFSAAGITTATTRTLAAPDANTTIVGTDALQTLTLKTLTDCDANTQAAANSTTKVATTAFVQQEIATAVALPALWSTGDVKITLKATADPGWLMMADQTIGSATSGATYANANAQALFLLLWTNVTDTYAPVVTGRGASAAADWAANKRITTTKVLGRVFAVAGTGATLTARTLGQTLGEENHALTGGENGPHGHTTPGQIETGNDIGGGAALAAGLVNNGSTGVSGSGTPHNTMQPTSFFNVMVKL